VTSIVGIGMESHLIVLPTSCSIAGIMPTSVWPSQGLPSGACAWATNWPAFAMLEVGSGADLGAEFIGFVRLAFADALRLGSVQATPFMHARQSDVRGRGRLADRFASVGCMH
jgi:hypothetical protein